MEQSKLGRVKHPSKIVKKQEIQHTEIFTYHYKKLTFAATKKSSSSLRKLALGMETVHCLLPEDQLSPGNIPFVVEKKSLGKLGVNC